MKNEVVILHHGHIATDFLIGNYANLIRKLLSNGYEVAHVFMPQFSPVDAYYAHPNISIGDHCHSCFLSALLVKRGVPEPGDAGSLPSPPLKASDYLFDGNGLQAFFEPAATMIAYLLSLDSAKKFHMVGLSGGGWTATVYPALDTRIKSSFAVQPGLMPFYLLRKKPGDDWENCHPAFFNQVTVQDLYVLASSGGERTHTQIFIPTDESTSANLDSTNNRRSYYIDPSLEPDNPQLIHGVRPLRPESYEAALELITQKVTKVVGPGRFHLVRDYPPGCPNHAQQEQCHLISDHIIETVILPTLRQ